MACVAARTAAELTGVNRNTAILFFHKPREIIAARLAVESPFLAGEIEVDESYFGGRRKGKRGRASEAEGLSGRCRSSGFSSAAARCMR